MSLVTLQCPNYGPEVLSQIMPVNMFINKTVLNVVHLYMICNCFSVTIKELNNFGAYYKVTESLCCELFGPSRRKLDFRRIHCVLFVFVAWNGKISELFLVRFAFINKARYVCEADLYFLNIVIFFSGRKLCFDTFYTQSEVVVSLHFSD